MQLVVEKVTTAKTGKSLRVLANAEWYGAKKDSGITAGATIDAEVSDGDYGKWIDKWRPINAGAQVSEAATPGRVPPSHGLAPASWLPFASNTVAHAITAGHIKTPADVKPWAEAAKKAFEELTA